MQEDSSLAMQDCTRGGSLSSIKRTSKNHVHCRFNVEEGKSSGEQTVNKIKIEVLDLPCERVRVYREVK